ncbi:hypothetical protein JB92DRAFT_2825116 [Gautieria morchelliformis]|nr:hypothetical protein JB92DRAFT_2825116 [Gautieria morchelliformis]
MAGHLSAQGLTKQDGGSSKLVLVQCSVVQTRRSGFEDEHEHSRTGRKSLSLINFRLHSFAELLELLSESPALVNLKLNMIAFMQPRVREYDVDGVLLHPIPNIHTVVLTMVTAEESTLISLFTPSFLETQKLGVSHLHFRGVFFGVFEKKGQKNGNGKTGMEKEK